MAAENTVDLARETAKKVDRILFLLEGDDDGLQPGLIQYVRSNTKNIEQMKQAGSRDVVSSTTLYSVAWLLLVLVPALTFFDRMVLISDVRADLELYGYAAVFVSAILGMLAKSMLSFVLIVFVLRWIGWGSHG